MKEIKRGDYYAESGQNGLTVGFYKEVPLLLTPADLASLGYVPAPEWRSVKDDPPPEREWVVGRLDPISRPYVVRKIDGDYLDNEGLWRNPALWTPLPKGE